MDSGSCEISFEGPDGEEKSPSQALVRVHIPGVTPHQRLTHLLVFLLHIECHTGLHSCHPGVLHGTTIEDGGLLAENLETVACALHHKDPALIINVYCYGPLELLLTFLQALSSLPASHHHRI